MAKSRDRVKQEPVTDSKPANGNGSAATASSDHAPAEQTGSPLAAEAAIPRPADLSHAHADDGEENSGQVA